MMDFGAFASSLNPSPPTPPPQGERGVKAPPPLRGRGWGEGGQKSLAGIFLIALLSGCLQEPTSGPVEVKWDRDTCVRCNMALSDKRYAAQVRGGPKHKAYKFDDIGCVVFWLKDKPWADDPTTEIWVMDSRSDQWIDARKAYYQPGKMSPMAYGFGAVKLPEPGSVTYEEARKQILAKGR